MAEILPAAFLDKMKRLLGDEYEQFVTSYQSPRAYGLRVNTLKADVSEWLALTPMKDIKDPIPWSMDGFYYPETGRPGTHPHYHAGLYYIQEPSAMLPVELLDVRPGNKVLDLCAAPGGKSVQIGARLRGEGVLVSNDNAYERTKPLAKNIAMAGIRNAVVLNEEPERLAERFPMWFDRILVDAPCSGEGMFRKDESMAASWEKHSVERCSAMQRDILVHAAAMLAPGGRMLYSTCTFSPEENEEQIAVFLRNHPDFSVVPAAAEGGLQPGRPDWIDPVIAEEAGYELAGSLSGAVRIWPHRVLGEGHFAVVLQRNEDAEDGAAGVFHTDSDGPANKASGGEGDYTSQALRISPPSHRDNGGSLREGKKRQRRDDRRESVGKPGKKDIGGRRSIEDSLDPVGSWATFCRENLCLHPDGELVAEAVQDKVVLKYFMLPSLEGLKVVRGGWLVGEAKRNRFTPSQPLAMALTREQALRSVSWGGQDERVMRYLRGETLFLTREELVLRNGASAKGYVLVCVDGFPLGWGKYSEGMLKNELAAGWRRV